jgi:hypothetical protein
MKKQKTYTKVIMVSRYFMKWHLRAGQETNFARLIKTGQRCNLCSFRGYPSRCMQTNCTKHHPRKIHTCRCNYPYWEEEIQKLKERNGVLSIRNWTGKPYASKQEVIVDIPSCNVHIQKLMLKYDPRETVFGDIIDLTPDYVKTVKMRAIVDDKEVNIEELAANDGLSYEDYAGWFYPEFIKRRKVSRSPIVINCHPNILDDMAIIHFTGFRY